MNHEENKNQEEAFASAQENASRPAGTPETDAGGPAPDLPHPDAPASDALETFEEYERRWSRAVENRADDYRRERGGHAKKENLLARLQRQVRENRQRKFEAEREAERMDFSALDEDLDYSDQKAVRGLHRRRRMHHDFGYSCLTAILYAAFILGVSMFCAGFIIMCANEVFAFVRPDVNAVVEINEEDSYAVVAEKLEDAGLIEHPWLFRLYCNVSNPTFRSGKFELNANLDYNAMKKALTRVSTYRETVWVTIPEGYTARQIADTLEEKGVCTAQDFLDTAENGEFDYDFLPQANADTICRLEGYLFPDTYQFYVGDDPENVVRKFLNNFEVRFTEKLVNRTADMGLTMGDVMIIASMIEREAKLDYERPMIASVIFNRLNDPATFPYLQIDATVQYILGRAPTSEDLAVDSPYNTYINTGLTPGPICNPGIDAITAVLYPEDTDYHYYVACADGTHIFSRTYEEHQNAITQARATFEDASAAPQG